MINWVEKYRPKSLSEVRGDSKKLLQLKNLILEKKPVIVYGNTGVGKTCSVYALANDLNYEVVEINASDLRNKESIDLVIGRASEQQSLFKAGKILLIDEIDTLTKIDKNGANAILQIINKIKTPLVLTANDPYIPKLSSVRKKCKLIELEDVKISDILNILKKILKKEKIEYDDELLMKIAKQSKGDLRAAINDLEVSYIGKEAIKDVHLSEREKKEDIFEILRTIFKKRDVKNLADKLSVDFDELILWLEENLPKEYYEKDLAKGFDILSKVDILRNRMKTKNYWRLLVYIRDLLIYGVALSKEYASERFTSYRRNQRILKYWIAKQKNLKRKEIAFNLSKKLHTSTKKIINDFYFYEKINSKFQIFKFDN